MLSAHRSSLVACLAFVFAIGSPGDVHSSPDLRPEESGPESPWGGFDPFDDLEGFEEATFGDFSRVFDFEPFESRAGERLSSAELAKVREEWKVELERGNAEIKRIKGDPAALYAFDTEGRLGRRQFFTETELDLVVTHAPHYFFVERPFKRKAGFEEKFTAELAPWTSKLEEVFARTYAKPLGLERKRGFGGLGVVVLASRGRYSDYADKLRSPSLHQSAAHYDSTIRASVTHRSGENVRRSARDVRRSLLHELVHGLQDAHCVGQMPKEVWLTEGMAEYLSSHGKKLESLDEHPMDKRALELLTPFTDPQLAKLLLPSLSELVTLGSYREVVRWSTGRLQQSGRAAEASLILGVHYAHANLMFHFMHHGEGGAYEQKFLDYVGRAMGGGGGLVDLKEAFEGVNLAELDQKFVRYVRDAYRKTFPKKELPVLGPNAMPVEASAATPRTPFDPEDLALTNAPFRVELGRALKRASQGAVNGAATGLEAWLEANPDHENRARVETEIARLRGFEDLRRTLIEQIRKLDKKLLVTTPEGRLVARVSALDGSVVKVQKNSLGLTSIDLEAVDPIELAKLMRNRSKYKMKSHWLMAYPQTIAGTPGEEPKFVSGGDSKALKKDHEDFYPAIVRSAGSAAKLDALRGLSASIDAKSAPKILEQLNGLIGVANGPPWLADKQEALVDLAERALAARFESQGLQEALNAEVEEGQDGVVTVTYDFDDPAEAQDFVAIEGKYPFPGGLADNLPRNGIPFKVEDGNFEAMGLTCVRHKLPLELTSLNYEATVGGAQTSGGVLFAVGFNDDGYGSFASSLTFGTLMVFDKSGGSSAYDGKMGGPIYLEQAYTVDIEVDNGAAELDVDGKQTARILLGNRTSGSLFLSCAMGSTLKIHSLEFSGVVNEAALASMSADWVTAQMAERGWSGAKKGK